MSKIRGAVLSAFTIASVAEAQRPPLENCNRSSRAASSFSVAASGGISKGAYQAGALWSIFALEREARQDTSTARNLRSLAGASAGNINAMLLALEWATEVDTARSERESPLWKSWTNVGFEGMIPEKPAEVVASLLEVASFDDAKELVRTAAVSGTFVPCEVPIGITMTRASNDGRYVFREIRDLTIKRYASVAALRTAPRGYSLLPLKSTQLRPSAGAAVSAPVNSEASIDLPEFLDHVQASAAFPFAFPPVKIRFTPVDPSSFKESDCGNPGQNACVYPKKDYFLDGGVFDNNPMALALDLIPSYKNGDPLSVWFVSPGQRRGKPGEVVRTNADLSPSETTQKFGVLKFAQFGLSVIGAAADYELFSLERQLREAKVECTTRKATGGLCILPTSRFFPIYGATANSFGAFLGKPLRELDFYIGVYDGLYASYQNGECATVEATAQSECVKQKLRAAIPAGATPKELSIEGRRMLAGLWELEFQGALSDSLRNDASRVGKLLHLLSALDAYEHPVDPKVKEKADATCAKMSPELSIFCVGGLRQALVAHGSTDHVKRIVSLDGQEDEVRFRRIVESFDAEMFKFLRPMAHRQWQVESGTQSGRYFTRMGAKIARYLVSTSAEQYRRGVSLDPSTVPTEPNEGSRRLLKILPYSYDRWRGQDRISWSPSVHLGRGFDIGVGPSIVHRNRVPSREEYGIAAGGRLRTMSLKAGSFSFALEGQYDRFFESEDGSVFTAGITTLRRRLKLGYAWNIKSIEGKSGMRAGGFLVGVNDVPGLSHLVMWQR